ncbi:MAG: helix-turn-helix domain-containing protein [Deltaproteobacteria bacterium]|nr:helix-turn-helix domain-containing protein [Deltaproteobacteria bacterium]
MSRKLLSLTTPGQLSEELGKRIRQLRLLRNWTRKTLASRAGVTPSSLKRFETTGKASLSLILGVAYALDRLEDFEPVFMSPKARSLAELEKTQAFTRRRGRK